MGFRHEPRPEGSPDPSAASRCRTYRGPDGQGEAVAWPSLPAKAAGMTSQRLSGWYDSVESTAPCAATRPPQEQLALPQRAMLTFSLRASTPTAPITTSEPTT